ncbi:glycosyltransferase family 4 protein [Hydromonas duriensis]|nr:glycosyltransferase family 4 protein [Hydromonas duriensis]
MTPTRLLILHQNFPGQFRHLINHWKALSIFQVNGLGLKSAPGLDGFNHLCYELHRQPNREQHPYLRTMERAVLHGQAVARILLAAKKKGYQPDVVLAHPGWGDALYVRDIYPDARIIHFCEWFYSLPKGDLGFDSEFPDSFDQQAKIATWDALHSLNLVRCDAGVTPTQWQRSRHPELFHHKLNVIHEGIDTEQLNPDANATFKLPNGIVVRAGDPIVTYVARNLEPYRGFHTFMRALERIQKTHKTCHAIIVGGDDISYGARPKNAPNWRKQMLDEVSLDPARTHFLGKVPYQSYKKVLQVSAAHIYLTYPFVLSWSMLEAMASGCLIIGSRTPPVEEIIEDGVNGVLVDFFNPSEIAQRILTAFESPQAHMPLRQAAEHLIKSRYTLAQGETAYRELILQRG